MKIGVDIRPLLDTPRSGVGIYTLHLLNSLFTLDKKNEYHLFKNSRAASSIESLFTQYQNVHHHSFRYPNILLNLSLSLLQKPAVDTLLGGVDIFLSTNLGSLALSPHTKHIQIIHDLSFEVYPEFFTAKQRWWHRLIRPKRQCKQASTIIAVSKHSKRDLIALYGIPEKKIQVIYPGAPEWDRPSREELDRVRHTYRLPEQFILFLGTIEPRKNIDGVIAAHTLLTQKKIFPYALIIAGPLGWKYRKILKEITRVADTTTIRYIGPVEEKNKNGLYALARLLVFPSFYEGFGFPPLEAMRAHTPSVVGAVSSLGEVVGDAGLLVHPYRIHELAYAIELLAEDEAVRNHYQEKMKLQIQKFNWQKTAQAVLQCIEDVYANRH